MVTEKIALSANDGKKMQPIDSIETYAYRTNEEIVHKKEEFKSINVRKQCKKILAMTILQKKT